MRALPKRIFVAGIGTGIGKTVVAAILVEALEADYWKPIQCGNLDASDAMLVQSLAANAQVKILPEAHRLQTASSPHYASAGEGVEINASNCKVPVAYTDNNSSRRLIIEGAGGLLVPINRDSLMIDLIKHFEASVVLVSKNYLGSINHTLLSIEALRSRGIDLLGIVFNGSDFFDNESIIQHFAQVDVLGKIPYAPQMDSAFVKAQAEASRRTIAQHFTL